MTKTIVITPNTFMEAKHSRERCMRCKSKPVVDAHWADGRGRAWFCLKCFKEWLVEEGDREIVRAWYVKSGEVPENMGDGDQVQIRKLNARLSNAELVQRLESLIAKGSGVAEAGKRVRKARIDQAHGIVDQLHKAADMLEDFLAWANYDDVLPETTRGLYLVEPNGELIASGKKTSIAKARKLDLEGQWILVSGHNAYGAVGIGEPEQVGLAQFDERYEEHRVSERQREKWWPNAETLWLYPIATFSAYSPLLEVELPDGVQTVIDEVEFKKAVEAEPSSGLKTFKAADGRTWLLLWTMNAFEDREDETFETKAIEDYVERHEDEAVKCAFQFWHVPGTKFGNVLWQGTAGRFLAEIGTFDDTEIGQAFKEFFQRHPDGHPVIAPHGWGASHRFLYDIRDEETGTYRWFEKEESTVLPSHEAANLWNPKMEVLMDEKQEKALAAIGEEMGIGGEKLVKLVTDAGEAKTRELEDGNVAWKAFDGVIHGLDEIVEQLENEDAKKALGTLIEQIKALIASPAPEEEGEEVNEGDIEGDDTEPTSEPTEDTESTEDTDETVAASTKALTHNSTLADAEPGWGNVDKTELPRNAHARTGEADAKSTWGFPHHWVQGGGDLNEDGIYTTGTMYLHRGGLIAAWGAAQGARAGVEAEASVKSHLDAHRQAVGLSEADLGESSGRVLGLLESSEKALDGDRAPLYLYVKLIEPGWGNERDNHYYPAEVLERDAHVFEGAKMYLTDHGAKSVRDEVSLVERAPVFFTASGAPVGLVCIHNPDFAEATRNRAAAGHLDTLECSILAKGIVRPGYKADGREGGLVEAINAEPRPDIDWVTRAGAGGQALDIVAESAENAEAEEANLDENEIKEKLDATNLPDEAKEWLAEASYADAETLDAAIEKAIERVKSITGSGRVFGQDLGSSEADGGMSKEDVDEEYRRIQEKYGLTMTPSSETS